MLSIKGWSHVLLEDGVLVGVAMHVETIEDYGPMGVAFFFGSHQPPEYMWLYNIETVAFDRADSLIVQEARYELARNRAVV